MEAVSSTTPEQRGRADLDPPPRHGELEALAFRVRQHVIRMSGGGGCFIGASLSCADLLVYLYSRVLKVDPRDPGALDRDVFLLSKGHDVPALYGTLAELGFIPRERLRNHLTAQDHLYWHPNRAVPGIEFHSGSLGHLLSVGIGVALDLSLRGSERRVFVLLGDGECNEGSVWEALLVASALRLTRLVVVIDRNELQANARTEELVPLEPLCDKLRAFGWEPRECDGHDFAALEAAFSRLPPVNAVHGERPVAVVARTVRGKGLPSLEGRVDRWFVAFRPEEIEGLLGELEGSRAATITSEPLMVR